MSGDFMGHGWSSGWGVLAFVAMAAMMGWMMRGGRGGGEAGEDPVEVLKARYARGELTTEEFQERLRTIEDARGLTGASPRAEREARSVGPG